MNVRMGILWASVFWIPFFNLPVKAEMTPTPPASQSPHWNHITIYDSGQALPDLADQFNKAFQWFLAHVDATEANGLSRTLKKANPGIRLSHHQSDLTEPARPDAGSLPEEYFFHVSEPTELRFVNRDG